VRASPSVIIAALILFVSLATMRIPGETSSLSSALLQDPSSTFAWGDDESTTTSAAVTRTSSRVESKEDEDDDSESSREVSTVKGALSQSTLVGPTHSLTTESTPASTRNVVNLGSTTLFSPSPTGAVPTAATSSSSIVWWTPETTTAAQQVAQAAAQPAAAGVPSILPA
jgi:hypothetical protein